MIKHKGTKIVEVYEEQNKKPEIGGMMVSGGGYLGVAGHLKSFFYFDQVFPSGTVCKRKVLNIKKAGRYRMNQLISP
jgi:hypothetical protein